MGKKKDIATDRGEKSQEERREEENCYSRKLRG